MNPESGMPRAFSVQCNAVRAIDSIRLDLTGPISITAVHVSFFVSLMIIFILGCVCCVSRGFADSAPS